MSLPVRMLLHAGLLGLCAVQAASASDITAGATLYRMHCLSCHGASGAGEFPGTTAFSRGNALLRSDVEILARLQRGQRAMPGYLGIMTDEELFDLISFLRTLQ